MARSVRISEQALVTALFWIPEESPHPRDVAAREELREALGQLGSLHPLARLDRTPKGKPRRKSWRQLALARKKRQSGQTVKASRDTPLVSRKPSRSEKRDETAKLWQLAMSRSCGVCECGCGRVFHEEGENKPEMDHQASRRVPQTIQNVWMLALHCHRMRQGHRPSERFWLGEFLRHCREHGYLMEARRVEDRIAVTERKTTFLEDLK